VNYTTAEGVNDFGNDGTFAPVVAGYLFTAASLASQFPSVSASIGVPYTIADSMGTANYTFAGQDNVRTNLPYLREILRTNVWRGYRFFDQRDVVSVDDMKTNGNASLDGLHLLGAIGYLKQQQLAAQIAGRWVAPLQAYNLNTTNQPSANQSLYFNGTNMYWK
jgi:hypothetical protein